MEQCLLCGEGCEFLIADEKQPTPCCSTCFTMKKNDTWKTKTNQQLKELFSKTRQRYMRFTQ